MAGGPSPPEGLAQNTPRLRQSPIGDEELDRTGRRTACNQCKQQKLRCSLLTSSDKSATEACSRCQRFELECKVESGFRRTRKRRHPAELENEIRVLRQRLETQDQQALMPPIAPDWPVLLDVATNPLSTSPSNHTAQHAEVGNRNVAASVFTNDSPTDPATGPSPDSTEHSRAPGLTTKPGTDGPVTARRGSIPAARPRALGNAVLSVEEIDELFMIFIKQYHPFLPLIDPTKSPHEYYETSELLFWSIISIASRRLRSQPTLLPKLARSVTDLLWRTIRSVPYSITAVQALALLCTWPFPTSSSTTDPTFMLAGLMLQIGTQMGLHRALDVQDFIKVPLRLSALEYTEWVRTWKVCNIVAQSVSTGCGLPIMVQIHDWVLTTTSDSISSNLVDESLCLHLRIEQFRHRVSLALTSGASSFSDSTQSRERLALYRLLNASLLEIERSMLNLTPINAWYLSAARLHLHAFYLSDDATSEGYNERIITLYQTAFSLIEVSQEIQDQEIAFLDYCPFFCYQSFTCAAFVVLKIIKNGFFCPLLHEVSGIKLLETAIVSLRKMSIVNNDLPARIGDVIGFFCTLSDPSVIGGVTVEDLELRQVKNRLSMSIVYDSLWTWRKHFQAERGTDGNDKPQNTEDKFSSTYESGRWLIYLEYACCLALKT